MTTAQLKGGYALYPYQTEAIEWMRSRERANPEANHGIGGGMLALSMGLGKTLTALEHVIRSRRENNETVPTLIITSKTVMYEWQREGVEKFYNGISVVYLHKDLMGSYVNAITAGELVANDIVFTTYDVCLSIFRKNDLQNLICEYGVSGWNKGKVVAIHPRRRPTHEPNLFRSIIEKKLTSECLLLNKTRYQPSKKGTINIYNIPWERVICDESQRFSNSRTAVFKAMMAIYGKHKWCLTGTPIRNHDTDMWSQLRFCGYNGVQTRAMWKRRCFEEHHLRQYMYEANYASEAIEMPEKIEHHYSVEMDPDQELVYRALLLSVQNMYELMLSKLLSYACVLALFTRLRQNCVASNLIVSKKINGGSGIVDTEVKKVIERTSAYKWISDEHDSAGIDSPKIRKITEIIAEVPSGEKIIVFSMFSSSLRLIAQALDIDIPERGYGYLDGGVNGRERIDVLDDFKKNPKTTILLVNYKIGGEGLNLTEATQVICVEPWWCPSVHDQAVARAWRRGQTRPVHIHWVVTAKTIEVLILKLCKDKERLSEHYLHGAEYDGMRTAMSRPELQRLLQESVNLT